MSTIKSNVIKAKIFILTETADGELYSIETDGYNELVNYWYGESSSVLTDNAKVFFASYNGVPVNPYLYSDFTSLVTCLREIELSNEKI